MAARKRPGDDLTQFLPYGLPPEEELGDWLLLHSPTYWIAMLEGQANGVISQLDLKQQSEKRELAFGILENLAQLRFHLATRKFGAVIGNAMTAGMLAERLKLNGVLQSATNSREAMRRGKQLKHAERLELFRVVYTAARESMPNRGDDALFDLVGKHFVDAGHKKPSRTTMTQWKRKLKLSNRRK